MSSFFDKTLIFFAKRAVSSRILKKQLKICKFLQTKLSCALFNQRGLVTSSSICYWYAGWHRLSLIIYRSVTQTLWSAEPTESARFWRFRFDEFEIKNLIFKISSWNACSTDFWSICCSKGIENAIWSAMISLFRNFRNWILYIKVSPLKECASEVLAKKFSTRWTSWSRPSGLNSN